MSKLHGYSSRKTVAKQIQIAGLLSSRPSGTVTALNAEMFKLQSKAEHVRIAFDKLSRRSDISGSEQSGSK